MSSLLAQEIDSQPSEVARFLDRHTAAMRRLAGSLPGCTYALVAARGSSDHAATYARYVWGALAGLSVAPAVPSLHTVYRTPPRLEGALVVGISQSGQSPDVVAVVEEGRKQGRPTIALTNDLTSPLARAADHVFDLCATAERSIAATKTYTTELAAVALLGAALTPNSERIDELARMPEAMDRVLTGARDRARELAAELRDETRLLTIARGINLCTAEELALKLRELLRVWTGGFSAADFRHGHIALATPGLPALLIAPRGGTFEDLRALAGELRVRDAKVVAVSDDARSFPAETRVLPLAASVPEWLSPLTAVLPGQLLALALTEARGLDPDRPQGLGEKVVRTV